MVEVNYYCRTQGAYTVKAADQGACLPEEGWTVAGVERDTRGSNGKAKGGLSFYGPADVLRPADPSNSPYKETLEFMDRLEAAADGNGGTYVLNFKVEKQIQGEPNESSVPEVEYETVSLELSGMVTFEQLQQLGLIDGSGNLTDRGKAAKAALEPAPAVKATAPAAVRKLRGNPIMQDRLMNDGIVFYTHGAWLHGSADIPGDLTQFSPAKGPYTTEVHILPPAGWSGLGVGQTTNLIHFTNAVRTAYPQFPVRIYVDRGNGHNYDGYVLSLNWKGKEIKYDYVKDENGREVLMIGLNENLLPGLNAGAVNNASFKKPVMPLAAFQAAVIASIQKEVIIKEVPGSNKLTIRKIITGGKDAYIINVPADFRNIEALKGMIVATTDQTVANLENPYDAGKKRFKLSFKDGSDVVPANNASVAEIKLGAKVLKAGTDYNVLDDGTAQFTSVPKAGEYEVYMQIGGLKLDFPVMIKIGGGVNKAQKGAVENGGANIE